MVAEGVLVSLLVNHGIKYSYMICQLSLMKKKNLWSRYDFSVMN